jgi:hypothetical protein
MVMKNSTLLHEISPDQIAALFEGLKDQLNELKKNMEPKNPTEYLTRTEVSQLLKCDISSVHNWTVKGKLKAYGIANRVYYKRSEVEAALVPIGKNR